MLRRTKHKYQIHAKLFVGFEVCSPDPKYWEVFDKISLLARCPAADSQSLHAGSSCTVSLLCEVGTATECVLPHLILLNIASLDAGCIGKCQFGVYMCGVVCFFPHIFSHVSDIMAVSHQTAMA